MYWHYNSPTYIPLFYKCTYYVYAEITFSSSKEKAGWFVAIVENN